MATDQSLQVPQPGFESNRMARFRALHPNGQAPIVGVSPETSLSRSNVSPSPTSPMWMMLSTLLAKMSRQYPALENRD